MNYSNLSTYINTGNGSSPLLYIPVSNIVIDYQAQGSARRKLGQDIDKKNQLNFPSAPQNKLSFSTYVNTLYTGSFRNILNATGDIGYTISVGNNVYSGCYLNNYSIEVQPFKPVMMSAEFTITKPPTNEKISGYSSLGNSNTFNANGIIYTGNKVSGYRNDFDVNKPYLEKYFLTGATNKWTYYERKSELIVNSTDSINVGASTKEPWEMLWNSGLFANIDLVSLTPLHQDFADYFTSGIINGYNCSLLGMGQTVDVVQSSVKYTVSCGRSASYGLGSIYPTRMFLDTVEKQMDISSTNIKSLINLSGSYMESDLSATLKDAQDVLGAVIIMSAGSTILNQQINQQEGDSLAAQVVIKEIVV